jgi:hypothetical protein
VHSNRSVVPIVVRASLIGALVVATVMVGIGAAAGASRNNDLTKGAWQQSIAHLRTPDQGCFTASYPDVQWHVTKCTTGPRDPQVAKPGTGDPVSQDASPQTVGNGTDYYAQVSGSTTTVTGSFPNVSCSSSPGCKVTETGSYGHHGPGGTQTSNVFSLQVNTNANITTSACEGSPNSGCRGWIQFVYSSTYNSLNVEPALINYDGKNGACPTNFSNFGSGGTCYEIHLPAVSVSGGVTAAELSQVSLTGNIASGGKDTAEVTKSSTAYAVTDDSPVDAYGQWKDAEFDVFGDAGGSQALFSPDTHIQVKTVANNTSSSAPTCKLGGFTGETNNLNLVSTPALGAQGLPTIESDQTNGTASTASCAAAAGPTILSGYKLVEADTPVPANSQGLAKASCPSGDVVVGGGGYQGLQTAQQSINSSWPDSNTSWSVYFNNASSTATTGVAVAFCVKATSVHSYSRASGSAITVPDDSQAQSIVTCPSGTVSLGGGFFNDSTGVTYGAAASAPYGTNGWRTWLDDGPDGSFTGEAITVCAKKPAGWAQVNSPYSTNPSGSATTVSASCPLGTKVLGGGSFESSSSPQVMIGLTTSQSSLKGWHTAENNNSSSSESADAWGVCAEI